MTMKLGEWIHLVDTEGFMKTPEFVKVQTEVNEAIEAVKWPPGADEFSINPTRKGNGVKPIKEAFIAVLQDYGWVPEHMTFDAHYSFPSGQGNFAAEWETGNISSSHRAINRIALGNVQGRLIGGILIVPTKDLYWYLTDRVGNAAELMPYLPLWELWGDVPRFGYFAIVTVTYDSIDEGVPLIEKGTDGRALV
jgi:hypothetical protein